MMFRYHDDEEYYDTPNLVLERGCRCWSGSEEPCRYCAGEYECEGGCGALSYNCQCPLSWEELWEDDQLARIKDAFEYLCDKGEVPYGVMVGDDDTWDAYAPAIELAQEWYNNREDGVNDSCG